MAFNFKKDFTNFAGVNYSSPELVRDDNSATDLRNITLSDYLALTKRRGYKDSSTEVGGAGCTTYFYFSDGEEVKERLVFDDALRKEVELPFNVGYVGTKAGAIEIKFNEEGILQILFYEDGGLLEAFDCGNGYSDNEVTMLALKTAINGSTIPFVIGDIGEASDDGSEYLAHKLPITPYLEIPAEVTTDVYNVDGMTAVFNYPTGIAPSTNGILQIFNDGVFVDPISGIYDTDTALGDIEFDSLTLPFGELIITKIEPIFKPLTFKNFKTVTYGTGASSTPFSTAWAERNNANFELYSHVNHRNNLYILNKDGLFKYDGSLLVKAGMPKPVDITGDSGADATGVRRYRILYTYTDASGVVSTSISDEFEVTGLGETLTLPDPTDTGYDLDNINKVLLRTKTDGNTFFVHPTYTGQTSFEDTTADNLLIENYILPPFELNLVPTGKYMDVWRNQLVITGIEDDFDKVIYEDIEFSEGFSESLSFLTSTRQGGTNKGIKSQDTTLFIFKERSISAVTGDLGSNQFQVDTLADEGIGCLSHNSLVEYGGQIWFVSNKGIYTVSRSGLKPMSNEIVSLFNNDYRGKSLNRVVGEYWLEEDAIMWNIPDISINTNDNQAYALENSRVLVYKTTVGKWFIWDSYDFSAGISIDKGDIWFCGARLNSDGDTVKKVSETLTTLSELDFADNEAPIVCEYKDKWETVGEPSVPKKFNKVKFYSIDNPLQGFETTNFTLDFETEHDWIEGVESKNSLLFGSVLGWGEFEWGNKPYGQSNPKSRVSRLKPKKARALRLIFRNGKLYENILISGIEYQIAYEHDNKMVNR